MTASAEQSDLQAGSIRKKSRSPRAPGISLADAIREVDRTYGAYGHSEFNTAEFASALGMSAASGSFLNKAGALRDYGLIEGRGEAQRVSELYRDFYEASQSTEPTVRQRLALAALQNSDVFARLLQQFPNRVPDASALALRLESQDRFNRDRARVVAQAFRQSLADFGLLDSSGNLLKPRDPVVRSEGEAQVGDVVQELDQPSLERRDAPTFRVEVPLGSARRALLLLPDDLSEGDVRRIAAVLRAYVE